MKRWRPESKELKIPVPWGHIAAKLWGDEKNPPILVFHGRMDNAGAFDNLIPLLPDSYHYICFDLPSHGRSSHFPPHLPIYSLNFILFYKYVMKYFQQNSYIILGHSFGAHLALLYARLYPGEVDKLVMIDTVHLDGVTPQTYGRYLCDKFEFHINLEKKLSTGKAPTYTYEEAFKRLKFNRTNEHLSDSATKALLKRGLEAVGDGKYRFTLDQRMKDYLDQMHDFRYAAESLQHDPVVCPVLMLLANKNFWQTNYFQPVLKVLESFSNVRMEHIDGGHDVHNNAPETVAPLINEFLLKKDFHKYRPFNTPPTSLPSSMSSKNNLLSWKWLNLLKRFRF